MAFYKYSVNLSEKIVEELRTLSQDTVPVAEHIRRAIDEYLNKIRPSSVHSPSKPRKGD